MAKRLALGLILAGAAAPATADVKSSSEGGFEVAKTVTVKASPAVVYRTLGQPARWWNGAHSYSGDARNMTMVLRAGGCFCERVPKDKGSVEHARVVQARPGTLLRLSGGFGPLQAEGVAATLTWTIKALPSGGSEITQSYVVGGYVRGGAAKFAGPVDFVMSEQLTRLVALLGS